MTTDLHQKIQANTAKWIHAQKDQWPRAIAIARKYLENGEIIEAHGAASGLLDSLNATAHAALEEAEVILEHEDITTDVAKAVIYRVELDLGRGLNDCQAEAFVAMGLANEHCERTDQALVNYNSAITLAEDLAQDGLLSRACELKTNLLDDRSAESGYPENYQQALEESAMDTLDAYRSDGIQPGLRHAFMYDLLVKINENKSDHKAALQYAKKTHATLDAANITNDPKHAYKYFNSFRIVAELMINLGKHKKATKWLGAFTEIVIKKAPSKDQKSYLESIRACYWGMRDTEGADKISVLILSSE